MKGKKIFDPHKIRPADYRSRYPELKRIREFEPLNAIELIVIWWYANPTSDIIGIDNDMERIAESIKRAKFIPAKGLREDLAVLNFDEKWAAAIERMSKVEPSIRDKARLMIEKLIDNYEGLCDPDQYKDKDEVTNVKQFVDATTKIAQELPGLIIKMEEGFGVSYRSDDEDEQSFGFSREWHQNQHE